jgi:hypothetical protein
MNCVKLKYNPFQRELPNAKKTVRSVNGARDESEGEIVIVKANGAAAAASSPSHYPAIKLYLKNVSNSLTR